MRVRQLDEAEICTEIAKQIKHKLYQMGSQSCEIQWNVRHCITNTLQGSVINVFGFKSDTKGCVIAAQKQWCLAETTTAAFSKMVPILPADFMVQSEKLLTILSLDVLC